MFPIVKYQHKKGKNSAIVTYILSPVVQPRVIFDQLLLVNFKLSS